MFKKFARQFHMKNFLLLFLLGVTYTSKADTVDNYQIYINNILVTNDSGFPKDFLTLDKSLYNSTLEVYFNHCSGSARDRKIVIFSKAKSRVIAWQFQDEETISVMTIPISRICQKIKDDDTYEIYYYDSQIKNGRLLTRF